MQDVFLQVIEVEGCMKKFEKKSGFLEGYSQKNKKNKRVFKVFLNSLTTEAYKSLINRVSDSTNFN